MAYDSKLDLLPVRLALGNAIPVQGSSTVDLWDTYLDSVVGTTGTVLSRQADGAVSSGLTLPQYQVATTAIGPELAPAFPGTWTTNLSGGAVGTVTIDGSGVHFVGANNIASGVVTGISTTDNAVVRVIFTVANWSAGGCRVLIGGATVNHGATGTTRTGNGTYTENLTLNTTFSSTGLIRIQCTGTNGNNNFDVTSISVKRIS